MVKNIALRAVVAILCAGTGSLACADPFFVSISDQSVHLGVQPHNKTGDLLFALPQSEQGPKLWSEMSPKERAEIWPFLTPRMQRYYWRSMTEQDRRSMRAELSPSVNEKLRKRYASPDHYLPDDHGYQVHHRLSPEERQRMREQIREMHVEFYRYRNVKPPVNPNDSPTQEDLP